MNFLLSKVPLYAGVSVELSHKRVWKPYYVHGSPNSAKSSGMRHPSGVSDRGSEWGREGAEQEGQ